MRKARRRLLYIVIVLVAAAATAVVLMDWKLSLKSKKPEDNSSTMPAHKYSGPVEGPLIWEKRDDFSEVRRREETPVRMAAFRTTLPDPLPGEEDNVTLAADKLAGTVLEPGATFSMNAALGPYTRARGYREGPTYAGDEIVVTIGGGVCKVSTTLYNVAILANFEIVERYPHKMPVPYVHPGQDATVSDGDCDLKFLNNSGGKVLLWADTAGQTLYMAAYGTAVPPQVTWHHRTLAKDKKPVIYRTNPALRAGEEKVAVPGEDGLKVESWLSIKYPDGESETKNLGVDTYRPLPRVIERGGTKP